jgi:hypothetical protein
VAETAHHQLDLALIRGSAPPHAAHGVLCQRRKCGPHHLLHLKIQSGMENPHPLYIYASIYTHLHKRLDVTSPGHDTRSDWNLRVQFIRFRLPDAKSRNPPRVEDLFALGSPWRSSSPKALLHTGSRLPLAPPTPRGLDGTCATYRSWLGFGPAGGLACPHLPPLLPRSGWAELVSAGGPPGARSRIWAR